MGPFMGWNSMVTPFCTTLVMLPAGLPRFHARWSMSPSPGQDAQGPMPFPESLASYRNPRPAFSKDGVGSAPTAISPVTAFVPVSITDMVLEMRFSEYSVWACELSASPLGPRLVVGLTADPTLCGFTSTNQFTFPLVLTWATRSVPKDATYMKFPLGSKTTPAGCASAVLKAAGLGRME